MFTVVANLTMLGTVTVLTSTAAVQPCEHLIQRMYMATPAQLNLYGFTQVVVGLF